MTLKPLLRASQDVRGLARPFTRTQVNEVSLMIEVLQQPLSDHKLRLAITAGGTKIPLHRFFRLLGEDPVFRDLWSRTLCALPVDACRWECPPLSTTTASNAFECVVSDHPALARTTADPRDFAEHFAKHADARVIDFPNLGGDARLVVPCPAEGSDTDYAHLLSFLRSAGKTQLNAFWRRLGETVTERRQAADTVWISTAGMGVYWLHVRLDSRPKYYEHRPYAALCGATTTKR